MMMFLPPSTLLEVSTQDLLGDRSGIECAPEALNGTNGTDSNEDPGTDLDSLAPEIDFGSGWLLNLLFVLLFGMDDVVDGDLWLWLTD